MQPKSFQKLNITCVALCAFFLAGTALQWRSASAQTQVTPIQIKNLDLKMKNNGEQTSDLRPQTSDKNTDDKPEALEQTEQKKDVKENGGVIAEETVEESSSSDVRMPAGEAGSPTSDIPNEMNLPVPFTSQAPEADWSEPWQDACEEASVLMLDAYYKKYGLSPLFAKDEILKMVAWEEHQQWGNSITIEKVSSLATWYMGNQLTMNKKHIAIIENPTIDDIKQSIANGDPVLVVVYGKALPNPNFRNGGPEYHALIIRGYTQDSFITNDPGTRNGENFVYAYDDLMNAIHDWNGGDVEHGRQVVLHLQ